MLTMVCAVALGQTNPAILSRREAELAWNELASEVQSQYFARRTRGDEMASRLSVFKPRALSATTRSEFAKVVQKMFEDTGDSHFYFYTKDDQGYFGVDGVANSVYPGVPQDKLVFPSIGPYFWPTDAGYRVWMLDPSSPESKTGVRRGDIYAKCDGKPFHPIRSLLGRVGQTVEIDVRRGTHSFKIRSIVKRSRYWEDLNGFAKSFLYTSAKGRKYLLLWPPHMFPPGDLYAYFFAQGQKYDGVIVDLRDGLGGYFEPIFAPLFMPRARLDWLDGTGFEGGRFVGIDLPTVVLTNRYTVSAREYAAHYLRKHRSAKVIGEPTAGGVLGATVTLGKTWWNAMIPSQSYQIDGLDFERRPLQPDILMKDEYDEDGTDAVAQRACAELDSILDQAKPETRVSVGVSAKMSL